MESALAHVDRSTLTALQDDLLCIADTKLVLGNWFAECVMNGRSLPDFAAMLGMCTASYGQTRAIYHYLDALDYSYSYLERGRGPGQIRSTNLLDAPPENWQDFLAAIWLAEHLTWSLASGFLGSSDRTVAGIARKIGEEAYFHLRWAAGWFRIFADSPTECRSFAEAMTRRYPLALGWFGPPDATDVLFDAGLRDDPVDGIRSGFVDAVHAATADLGVDVDRLRAVSFEGWRSHARRVGDLPAGLFEVIRFKDEELAR
jgi:ring-1,2-phenylacetyl-CoA epoxidase subunit PaaC